MHGDDLCLGFLVAVQPVVKEVNHLVAMVRQRAEAAVGVVADVFARDITNPRPAILQRDRDEVPGHELGKVGLLGLGDDQRPVLLHQSRFEQHLHRRAEVDDGILGRLVELRDAAFQEVEGVASQRVEDVVLIHSTLCALANN
ncbi:hypothetical protein D9M68_835530 [compost metagenome]